MDIMMTEERSEQTEKIEHMRGLPSCNQTVKQMLTGRPDVSSLQPFGWQGTDLYDHERSLEPLTQTNRDKTTMDNHGDDDAGGNRCIQVTDPNNEAIGSRDCNTRGMRSLSISRLVGGVSQPDAHRRQREEQNGLLVASMHGLWVHH